MEDELEKLLSEEKEKETPPPSSDEKGEKITKEEEEVLKRQEHLANLQKAIEEANSELSRIRTETKQVKVTPRERLEEEDIPQIDMSDPSSKAWNRHIAQTMKPVQEELEKEKEEIRSFALKEFMADKPSLAKNTEKVKELVAMYNKIRTASERTKEGVLLDLQKAYAATHHEELLQIAKQEKIDKAKAESIFSDIAISKGATAYSNKSVPNDNEPKTNEEREYASKWSRSLEGIGIKSK